MDKNGLVYKNGAIDIDQWVGKPVLNEGGCEMGKIVSTRRGEKGEILGIAEIGDGYPIVEVLLLPAPDDATCRSCKDGDLNEQ